jgi:hypothetical protein
MGRRPLSLRAMTGAERQRRYWARIRARLTSDTVLPATATTPTLVWHRKTREATGTASDGAEYIVAQVPGTGEFELNFCDEAGDVVFLGDGFHSMADAEHEAEQHNVERFLQSL